MPTPTPRERAKWRNQPEWFATQRLGITLRQEQQQILKALRSHDLVAVQAPYGSSKTFAAALAVIWWLMAHNQHTLHHRNTPNNQHEIPSASADGTSIPPQIPCIQIQT